MKTGISVLLIHLVVVGSLIADERGQPLQKEMVIQMRHSDDMKVDGDAVARDGVKAIAHGEGAHWNVPPGSAIKVKFKIKGLTTEKLKGKRIALQLVMGSTQEKLVWINPSKHDLESGEVNVDYGVTLKHSGEWIISCGLVDPLNQEWWLFTSAFYSVKEWLARH